MTTAAVLFAGIAAFKSGNTKLSQHMMRARVLAQGGTVAIMLASVGGAESRRCAIDTRTHRFFAVALGFPVPLLTFFFVHPFSAGIMAAENSEKKAE